MNLTYGVNFPTALIKRAKTRVNQKINFQSDTKRRIQVILIKWLEHTDCTYIA